MRRWPVRSRSNGLDTHSSSSSRRRLGHCARQLKSRNCLLATDRGKALEKLVERIRGFEVVVQRLDGHSGPDKTGVPPRISGSLCTNVSLDMASCNLSLSITPGSVAGARPVEVGEDVDGAALESCASSAVSARAGGAAVGFSVPLAVLVAGVTEPAASP